MIRALINRRTKAKALLAVFVLLLTAWLPIASLPVQAAGPVTAHWFERATFQISGGNFEDSNFVYNPEASNDSTYYYQGSLKFNSSATNKCERSGMQIAIKKSDLTRTTQSTKIDSAAYATWDKCNDSETDAIRDSLNSGSLKITDASRLVESYKWLNDRTILADGGYLKGKGIEFIGGTGTSFSLVSTGTLEDGCVMGLVISNINAARTSATIKKGGTISSGDQKACSAELQERFNNKTISIADVDRSDDKPDDASTRVAVITVRPNHNIPPLSVGIDDERTDNVPATDTVKLTKQGESAAQQTLNPSVSLAFDYHSSGVWYTASFTNVQPGTYTACSTTAYSCVTFEKKLGEISRADINGQNTPIEPSALPTDTSTGEVDCGGNFFIHYLICPLFKSVNDVIGTVVQNVVQPLLKSAPLGESSAIRPIWENVRNITNVLFVLLFLVVIFSNAITQLDAYTVKKALPRLVAAAVLVQASYFICGLIIDIGNVLGSGVASLLTATVLGSAANGSSGVSGISQIITGSMVLGTGAIVATAAGLWVFMLPVVLAAAISMITFVFTLILRQVVLNALIIISPLAFVAWVLPGTEKFFKLWWSNIFKLIMMYPLIILLLGIGSIMSQMGVGGLANNDWQRIIQMIAPIVVFTMIPSTFKMSGNLMGFFNTAIQKRSSGYQGKVKGAQLWKDMAQTRKDRGYLQAGDESRSGFGRYMGKVKSGNGFSFGQTAQRRMAAGIHGAIATRDKDNQAIIEERGMRNEDVQKLAIAAMNNQKEFKYTDTHGNEQTMKITAGMAESAVSRLANNGGYKELAELTDGRKTDGTQLKWTDSSGTVKDFHGVFNKTTNKFNDQATETMWRRAIGGQSGTVNNKIPYAIHGAGLAAMEVVNASGISQLHSGAALTAAEAAFGGYVDATQTDPTKRDASKKAAANNAVRQLIEITKSSQYAGSTDRAVASAMKAQALKALTDGRLDPGMMVDVDGTPTSVKDYLDAHITDTGQITVNQKPTNVT